MRLDNTNKAFFALVQAGLWEKEVRLAAYGDVEFSEVYRLAREQSVIGLIAAGMEHVVDTKTPQSFALTLAGEVLQIEQRNHAMNIFIEGLVRKLRKSKVYALLVKGQGVAQCYERPLWRACGDIDLLLDYENYNKAKSVLMPLATDKEDEDSYLLHSALTIDNWVVELHGTLRGGLSRTIDNGLDDVQECIFKEGKVRTWNNNGTDVFLPDADNDAVFIFTHILQHYFHRGIGLRQLCDWCRLLWTYRQRIDIVLLENRLKEMHLITKWKTFAAFVVEYLGMPANHMPLYDHSERWKTKAKRVLSLVLDSGNFGQGRDRSYKEKYPSLVAGLISFWTYTRYSLVQFVIFPLDAIKGWLSLMVKGLRAAIGGK